MATPTVFLATGPAESTEGAGLPQAASSVIPAAVTARPPSFRVTATLEATGRPDMPSFVAPNVTGPAGAVMVTAIAGTRGPSVAKARRVRTSSQTFEPSGPSQSSVVRRTPTAPASLSTFAEVWRIVPDLALGLF